MTNYDAPKKLFYRHCDECGYEFEVEVLNSGEVYIEGEKVEPESDGSGWTLSTIHGESECDSTLIVHDSEV